MSEKRFELDWEDEEVCNFYAKRCRECCIHYDDVVADCYLGNNIYGKCECYKPKSTGKLQNSVVIRND